MVGTYPLTIIGGVITAAFHFANVYGASVTASFYNHNQEERLQNEIRKQVFSLTFRHEF
jgi:hypothetical protein